MAFLGLILLFIECFLGGFLIAYFLCSDGGSCKTNVCVIESEKDNEKGEELTEVTVETNGPEQFEKTSSSDAKQQLED